MSYFSFWTAINTLHMQKIEMSRNIVVINPTECHGSVRNYISKHQRMFCDFELITSSNCYDVSSVGPAARPSVNFKSFLIVRRRIWRQSWPLVCNWIPCNVFHRYRNNISPRWPTLELHTIVAVRFFCVIFVEQTAHNYVWRRLWRQRAPVWYVYINMFVCLQRRPWY